MEAGEVVMVDDDISVYSHNYYLHYAQGDETFAEFLHEDAMAKSERNRKILQWKDSDGNSHVEHLPEPLWRKVIHADWPTYETRPVLPPTPPPKREYEDEDEKEDVEPKLTAAEEEALMAEKHEREAEQRAEMRRQCMLAAETRRWDIRGWTMPQKRKREDDKEEEEKKRSKGGVPSLSELAEMALQHAFELRGEDIQLHEALRPVSHLLTPVVMNGELCRIFRSRPAVE